MYIVKCLVKELWLPEKKKKITLMVLMNSSNVRALMPYVIHVLIYKPYSLSSSSIYTDT